MPDPQTPPSTPPSPATPPPKQGMSTGAKVAIGCGILAVLAIVGIIVAIVAGGMFASKKLDELGGGLEAQQQAAETVHELEREHPFRPPPDGIVNADRAQTFFDVTDDAWEGMQDWVDEMVERSEDIESRGGQAGVRDAMAGLQGLGRSRVALTEALADHDMPVSEYLWTGTTLAHAYGSLDRPSGSGGVPPENLEIAADNRDRLAEIAEEDSGGRAVVLGIAWTLATTEGVTSSIPGLDTLGR